MRVTTFVLTIFTTAAIAGVALNAQTRLSPGGVALLVDPQNDAERALLAQALRDPDGDVRAAAARVAGISGRKDLAPTLLDLVQSEQHANAGAEQVRALLFLRGLEAVPDVRTAARRLGRVATRALSEWIARMQPLQYGAFVASMLPETGEVSPGDLGELAALAVRQAPAERDNLTKVLAGLPSGVVWRRYLDRSRADAAAETAALKAGLNAAGPEVREQTVWFLISSIAEGRSILSADIRPLISERTAAPGDDTEWTTFGRELLARRAGRLPQKDYAETISKHAASHRADARLIGQLSEPSEQERAALRRVVGEIPSPQKEPLVPEPVVSIRPPGMRLLAIDIQGFLGTLMAALKCAPLTSHDAFAAAQVAYHRDGRVKEVAIDRSRVKPECGTVLNIAAWLSLAPWDEAVSEGTSRWLVMPMNEEAIACIDEPQPSSVVDPERPLTGRIKTPQRVRNVNPVYPETMRQARVQGVVILDALVSTTGCVRNLEVLRSVLPPLDVAAMSAVAGWRFTPTLVGGVPVPVVMTVTVNFQLQ